MKSAGITIRRLTIIRDALQMTRNSITSTLAHTEDLVENQKMTTDELTRIHQSSVMYRQERARIDTALEEIRPAIVALTTLYARGWLDMSPETLIASVVRGRPQ